MTSRGLEVFLEGSIKNFATESMLVLKQLLAEGEETSAEADMAFTARVREFFNNSHNIWKKRKGVYIDESPQAVALRFRSLNEYSRALGMATDKVESLITRIMGAVPRALNKKPRLLEQAFTYAHKGFVGEDEVTETDDEFHPEVEDAEGNVILGDDITYEDIEGALEESYIYEEA